MLNSNSLHSENFLYFSHNTKCFASTFSFNILKIISKEEVEVQEVKYLTQCHKVEGKVKI
jgi:hypothetical protein